MLLDKTAEQISLPVNDCHNYNLPFLKGLSTSLWMPPSSPLGLKESAKKGTWSLIINPLSYAGPGFVFLKIKIHP